MSSDITLTINDQVSHCSHEESDMSLLDYIREKKNLIGTKLSCGIGMCRACTVVVSNKDGLQKITSCNAMVASMEGKKIYTVESLGTEKNLSPLQKAFLEHFSFQCGYCTPGFLMTATAMMDHMKRNKVKRSDLDQFINSWMGDNICRCTGYVKYIEAIKEVALPLAQT